MWYLSAVGCGWLRLLGNTKGIIWIILLIPFVAHAESIEFVLIQSLEDSFVDYSHTEVHFFAGPQKADVYKIRDENPDFYKYLFLRLQYLSQAEVDVPYIHVQ